MVIKLDFLKSLDRLQIILKKRIHANIQGSHESSAGGQGLVFQDFKAYVPGDDFRHIDWTIYARTDKFFVKRFEEERNLAVHILVDSSASMNYGHEIKKFEYASMIGLGFSYMAMKRNEKFNFNTFTSEVTKFKSGKGANQLVKIHDFVSRLKIDGQSFFKEAMDSYKKNINSKSLIVLISDFLYDLEEVRLVLKQYHKSEIYIIQVLDPAERDLRISGDVILEDAETHSRLRTFVSRRMKQNYQSKIEEHIFKLKDLCDEVDANFISVTTDTPIFETFYHVLS